MKEKRLAYFLLHQFWEELLLNKNRNTLNYLNLFGNYLGIAFQILDDVLDYDIHSNSFGKKIGDDFKEGKVTLPLLIAYNKSNQKEKIFWKKVIEELDQEKNDLKKALDIISKYNSLSEAKNCARIYSEKAKEILKKLPQNNIKFSLCAICDFVLKRNN